MGSLSRCCSSHITLTRFDEHSIVGTVLGYVALVLFSLELEVRITNSKGRKPQLYTTLTKAAWSMGKICFMKLDLRGKLNQINHFCYNKLDFSEKCI